MQKNQTNRKTRFNEIVFVFGAALNIKFIIVPESVSNLCCTSVVC